MLPKSSAAATSESPLRFREGLLWLEAHSPQSRQPLHFLLDSGASASVVNLGTAKRLHLELGPKVRVNAVATTVTGYWPVSLSASASELELPGEYLALDLSKLADACAHPVDGLIGADFFSDRVGEID
jgi:hypothetical protein